MERLQQKLEVAQKASKNFSDILVEPYSSIIRDATIKRFELAYEACWKLLQRYFLDREKLEVNSPRAVWRECLTQKTLNESEVGEALAMANDRNLAVHIYDDDMAENLYKALPKYATLIAQLVSAVQDQLENNDSRLS